MKKFLYIAISSLALALIAAAFIFCLVYKFYPANKAAHNLEKVRTGFSQEIESFLETSRELGNNPEIASALANDDTEAVSRLLAAKINERGTRLIAATNQQGTVLARTRSTNTIGDNFFINNPLGRKLSQSGEDAFAFQGNTTNPRQLILLTGHVVYQEQEKVGALFLGYSTDDTYARYFVQKYLPPASHLVFYTNEYGLSGASVEMPIGKELLNRYIKPELDLLKEDYGTRLVRLPDHRLFIVQNLMLPGAEDSLGGVLIFTPLPYWFLYFTLGFLVPLLFLLAVLWFVRYRTFLKKKKTLHFFEHLSVSLVAVYSLACVLAMLLLYASFFNFKIKPYPLYNSILRFQPEGGVFDRRFAQRISVMLDSGGEAINAIRLSLQYNPDELRVQSIDMDRSICEHFIVSNHNSQTGQIEMECIIPNPGFKGSSAVVSDLFFKAEPNTTFTSLRFLDDSQVLANDGLATNVLRMAVNSTIKFADGQAIADQNKLIVFSPTHPNPERWYSKRTVFLSWAPSILGEIIPDGMSHTGKMALLPPIKKIVNQDGRHKFTIQAKNERGEIISGEYSVNIDKTPPEELFLSASETKIKPGGLVRFTASGKDSLSGLQRVFYLKINDEIFFPIGSEIHIPFPEAGTYNVTLRAYDKAGNYRDVSQKIIVRRYQ